MKTIIISIVGVIIIGLIIWGVSNSQKQSAQPDVDATTIQATTTQVTTGNTITLEDNRLPSMPATTPTVPSQGFSFEYVPTLVQSSLRLGINETATSGKITITPKKIYDNRCPKNINCDKSDIARVMFGVVGPITTKNITMAEGQAFVLDDVKVILVRISPDQEKNKQIEEGEYEFELQIELMQ